MKPALQLKQSQSLVMTPQLQQSIRMLQLSALELQVMIDEELEQNPLLNLETDDFPDETPSEEPEDSPLREETDITELTGRDKLTDSPEGPLDADFGNVWEPSGNGGGHASGEAVDVTQIVEQTASEAPSLRAHLHEQLAIDIRDPAHRIIGQHLIESLDENGLVAEPLAEIAKRLGCEPALVEKVLLQMQHFDPPGICARTLSECLSLQLRERNRLDPAMETLLAHLDKVAARDTKALAGLCGVSEADITDMCEDLRTLNPRPGSGYPSEAEAIPAPDVIVKEAPDGSFTVELNPETLPRLLVNQQYFSRILPGARDKEEKRFLTDRLGQARWLVKALQQRADTILKVSTEIVAREQLFFKYGIAHLTPLTLREIAEKVAMHESTISRVTANKTMTTPRGTFDLKYFFTSSVTTADGEDMSSSVVKHKIKQLIDAEAPDAILSDDAIAKALTREGINVARRTVAKYREALHLPSSTQRRREKRR